VVDLLVWRGHTSRSTTSICSEPSGAPAALTAIAGVLSCALVEFELADEPVRFPKKRTKPLAAALFHLYSLRPAPLRARVEHLALPHTPPKGQIAGTRRAAARKRW